MSASNSGYAASVSENTTTSSFSAWFKEADQNAKAGGDPLAASTNGSSSNGARLGRDYYLPVLPDWIKPYAPSQFMAVEDELEAGELLSKSSNNAQATTATGESDYSLSRTERFKWFVALLSLGLFFFILSFFFLGVVLVFPGKFAFSFTCGSLFVMSAFILVQGFENWRKEVCQTSRLWFSLSYFGSIFGTLFATLYLRNYLAIMACSALQLSALGWYFATYVPGGQHGMRMITAIVKTTCGGCVKACRLCIGV